MDLQTGMNDESLFISLAWVLGLRYSQCPAADTQASFAAVLRSEMPLRIMGGTMTFTHVDQPIIINGLVLKNRIFRSAHATGLATMALGDEFIAYHLARARGGVALS